MRIRTLALTLAVLMAVPAATAGWMSKGIYEPDTLRDAQDGWMRSQPDQSATSGRLVYFNAFTTQSIGVAAEVSTSVNPNVGSLQTGYITSSGRGYALMGVWKDCNKDGFVGWGDQGLFEYRSTLLTVSNVRGVTPGESVCPRDVLPNPLPRHDGAFPHNDGEWVREFLPIGYDITKPTSADNNPFNLVDWDARVWWDWGLPEDRTRTRCYAFAPQGTFHSTGGMLEWVDCFIAFKITDTYNALPIDGTPAGQLTFKDQPRDQSESRSKANVANPWGDEGGESYVKPWNCNAPQVHHMTVPNTDTEVGVSQPRVPPGVSTTGTLGGTANETATGLDDCDRSDNDGEWEHSIAAQPYGLEEDIINTKNVKVQTSYTLRFNEGFRNSQATNPQQLGRAAPRDLGTRATEPEGFWVTSSRVGESYNPMVDRESQSAQTVTHTTVYGFISPAAITAYNLKLKGTVGTYGSDHCNGLTPITGEWECDPAKWWLNPDGTTETRTTTDQVAAITTFIAARPGQAYNLRDIDCYDFSAKPLRDEGIHYGLASNTACVRPTLAQEG